MNVIIVYMIICEKTIVAFSGRKDYDVTGSEGVSFCILHNLHRSPCNDVENPALGSSFEVSVGRWNVNFASVCGKKEGKTKIIVLIQRRKLTCQVIVKKTKYVQNTAMPEHSMYPVPPAPTIVSDAVISSSVPTAVSTFVPTETPDIEQEAEWESGKQSGKKEDFEKYFNPEMKQYTKRQQGVPLGTIEEMIYPSEVVGGDREAYVYLPPEYDSSKKYPVLYLLHGIGCDRGQWRYMSLNEILSNMIYMGELQPIVAVIPSIVPKDGLNKDTFSAENIEAFTKFEDEFIKDLEPYVLANYGVSSEREDTGVCGLSMGGMEKRAG